MRLRDVNWLGDGTLEEALADEPRTDAGDRREVFVKVRSTRAPQPAWLHRRAGGVEVELIAGEDGVSPGQACVFYDAQAGQARVLGGGIIQSAAAAGESAPARDAVARRAAAPG
jgi:tRNA-specific 2-thiouridylase